MRGIATSSLRVKKNSIPLFYASGLLQRDSSLRVSPNVYNIQGLVTPPHFVILTAADLALLAQNGTFVVTSTNNAGHSHDMTVECAP